MQYLKDFSLLFTCIIFLTVTSFSQKTEAELLVTVKDQFDSLVVDAQVVLINSLEKEKLTKTNANGIARFGKIPAGNYQLTVSTAGFKEYKRQNLILVAGEMQKIDIVLELAPVETKVDISEDDSVSPENTGTATIIDENVIASLPNDPQELEKAISRLGEAIAGEQLPITVNGLSGGKLPPKEAIQQIRINQSVFSAQYDSSWGGGIEIFTRSNQEKFGGYVNFSFADARFNASDPFLGRRVPFQSRSYFFNLSGPIMKNTSFFMYGSHNESDSSSVINAIILDVNLQPAEFKQSNAMPNRSEDFDITINSDPTKKHKIAFNYNLQNSRAKGQNAGGFSLPSRAINNNSQSHFLQFSDTYLASSNIVNQTRLSMFYTASNNFGGSNDPAINVLDAFFGGGAQQDSTNKSFRFDATNDTTWQMGKYSLGFGFRARGEYFNQNSLDNFGGTYTFSGRLAPVLDADNNPVTDDDGNIVTAQINSLESYRRTLLFQQLGFTNQRIRELGGGANQFTISGGNPKLNISQYDVGLYIQNSYKISETIAASFGLRYETQTNISSNFNFAPRFGFIWAPKAKDKQKILYTLPRISVGYGLFYTRFDLNSTQTIKQASDTDRSQYLITETNILDLYPDVPTVDILQQFALPTTKRQLANKFETPYQSLFTITATKKLPKLYTLSFSFSRATTFRQAFAHNINAPLAGTFDPMNPSLAVRPFGNIGNIYESQSKGRLDSDRFSINLAFPQSEKLYASLRYSFFRSKNNVVNGSGSSFDPYDFSQERGSTTSDGVHNVGGYAFYSLPYKISIGTDFSIRSGSKFNITTGRDANGDGFFSERPSFATDLSKPDLIETPYGILDPNPSPTDILIPRNLGRGSKNIVFNSFLSKTIGFNEDKKNKKPAKQSLTFSARFTNVFNIINKGNPVGNMSSPNFLRFLTGYSDGGIVTINGARQVNFPGRSMSFSVGFGF